MARSTEHYVVRAINDDGQNRWNHQVSIQDSAIAIPELIRDIKGTAYHDGVTQIVVEKVTYPRGPEHAALVTSIAAYVLRPDAHWHILYR